MATTHIDIKLKITEGIGIGKTLADIARKYKTSLANIKNQVAAGMLVEAEHSSDPKKQQLTVMNHLWELGPKYYPELKKMEKKLEKGLKGVSPSSSYKNQHELNIAIQQFITEKDNKKEAYSQSDIQFINQYEGSGGQGKHGASGQGILYEFYTPAYICEIMWKLALKHGYNGGNVLEPACATGRLFANAPDKSKCVGFEVSKISARIAEINYPEVTIYSNYFETAFLQPDRFTSRIKKDVTWLDKYPFDLVIGNPPYGKYKGFYAPYFKDWKMPQIEQMFMYAGLQLLKKDGLLVFITGSNFLRNGSTYSQAKEKIGTIAEFVDAYRLPAVFRYSEVPTDIVIFRKK
jgi:hypothetical protein